jgi:hypothetical protein
MHGRGAVLPHGARTHRHATPPRTPGPPYTHLQTPTLYVLNRTMPRPVAAIMYAHVGCGLACAGRCFWARRHRARTPWHMWMPWQPSWPTPPRTCARVGCPSSSTRPAGSKVRVVRVQTVSMHLSMLTDILRVRAGLGLELLAALVTLARPTHVLALSGSGGAHAAADAKVFEPAGAWPTSRVVAHASARLASLCAVPNAAPVIYLLPGATLVTTYVRAGASPAHASTHTPTHTHTQTEISASPPTCTSRGLGLPHRRRRVCGQGTHECGGAAHAGTAGVLCVAGARDGAAFAGALAAASGWMV